MKRLILFVILLFIVNISLFSEILVIKYPKPQSEKDLRQKYRIEILKLALDKTKKEFGDYQIEMSEAVMSQSRAIIELQNDNFINVIAIPTSIEREKTLLPVRIPIFKGILGYRIFIIDKQNEKKFENVKTFDDLKKYNAGFGQDWADLDILKYNGLKVITSVSYESLFKMLDAARFEYFPRGINEIEDELLMRKDEFPNFTAEKNIALYYPFPTYFFVNKKNISLAKRIETGLNEAIKDGSFDKLFLSYFEKDIRNAALDKRIIFVLKNPYLPKETPLDNQKLWYFNMKK